MTTPTTTNTAARELLPCPFCGATWPSIALHSTLADRCFRVMCICGAEGGPFTKRDDEAWGTMEEAVAAWNTRLTQQQGGEQEALEVGISWLDNVLERMKGQLVSSEAAFDWKIVRDYHADLCRVRHHIEPTAALRSKQPAASEGDMARAAQHVKNIATMPNEIRSAILEALAAYDPERMARCGNTSKQAAGEAVLRQAIERARVFDDGSDGADAESARSVVALLTSLLTTPPRHPADEGMAKVVAFLLGEASLEGVWFGEKHRSGQPYWWRNNLRDATRGPNNGR